MHTNYNSVIKTKQKYHTLGALSYRCANMINLAKQK